MAKLDKEKIQLSILNLRYFYFAVDKMLYDAYTEQGRLDRLRDIKNSIDYLTSLLDNQ